MKIDRAMVRQVHDLLADMTAADDQRDLAGECRLYLAGLLASEPVELTPEQLHTVHDAIDDAWAYRLGEAANLDDPDLDEADLRQLRRYAHLLVQLDRAEDAR